MTEILQVRVKFLCSLLPMLFDSIFHILLLNIYLYFTHKSYQMVDNKSKTSLIRCIQKNISLMKINNIFNNNSFSVNVIPEVFLLYRLRFRSMGWIHGTGSMGQLGL